MAGVCGGASKYSCNTATATLEWIGAIVQFLESYRFLLDAHVVNFFKDRLWEKVDEGWMDCLRKEPTETLRQIPSGVVQDHWPASLQEYVRIAGSLLLPRNQADLQEAFPELRLEPLNTVIAQGMNKKKKHEIEVLAALVASIAHKIGANTIVDVGSGQGYLAQVLSFEHDLSVIAIDASSHHGSITDARAKRIEKYYAARKSKSRSENRGFSTPVTVTCNVLSPCMLKDACNSLMHMEGLGKLTSLREKTDEEPLQGTLGSELGTRLKANYKSLLLLAGLHACGDLSVTMLRLFVDCHCVTQDPSVLLCACVDFGTSSFNVLISMVDVSYINRTFVKCDEVKAMINVGCCYNLLSEEGTKDADTQCGFPVSRGAKFASCMLGKNARDLACQSAERWRTLEEVAGLHNSELHAFRAAFQMVLFRCYPEIADRSPAIGHQWKALRRRHHQSILESSGHLAESSNNATEGSVGAPNSLLHLPSYLKSPKDVSSSGDRYSTFVDFCKSGLGRLGLHESHDIEFSRMWKEAEESFELVGPYWTLRAALGPVVETLLLLDRLLFLQEQGTLLARAIMLPVFDPVLSPRNMALIAEKSERSSDLKVA